jgi:hypothetical protein
MKNYWKRKEAETIKDYGLENNLVCNAALIGGK